MSEPVCPYCRMPFDEASPPKIFCTACGMPHHEDCYQENGGCTVFGCKCAPADDPKLQVSQSDLSAVNVPVQRYAPMPQPNVTQQNASAQPYPQSRYGGPLGLSQAAAPARAQIAAPQPCIGASPARIWASHKSRTTYIVLGIFLGAFGIHNFYAGYVGRAVGQLCLTVLTVGYLGLVSWVWAIVEVCIVEKDSTGLNFS